LLLERVIEISSACTPARLAAMAAAVFEIPKPRAMVRVQGSDIQMPILFGSISLGYGWTAELPRAAARLRVDAKLNMPACVSSRSSVATRSLSTDSAELSSRSMRVAMTN
jgi:hypothetical protein